MVSVRIKSLERWPLFIWNRSKVQQLQEILCKDSGFGLRPSPSRATVRGGASTPRRRSLKRNIENVCIHVFGVEYICTHYCQKYFFIQNKIA